MQHCCTKNFNQPPAFIALIGGIVAQGKVLLVALILVIFTAFVYPLSVYAFSRKIRALQKAEEEKETAEKSEKRLNARQRETLAENTVPFRFRFL